MLAASNIELAEFAVWSGLAGMMIGLLLVSLTEVIRERSAGSVRGVIYLTVVGISSLAMSGWLEAVWPTDDAELHRAIRLIMPPCSAALALLYLGLWLQDALDDPVSRRMVVGMSLLSALMGLGLLALTVADFGDHDTLFGISAAMTGLCAMCGLMVTIRAWWFGDPLAHWMMLACAFLVVMTLGLLGFSADQISGAWPALLVAVCTVAYLVIAIALVIIRTRQLLMLHRLARGHIRHKPDVRLPGGTMAIRAVEEAMWRSARVSRSCAVAAVNITNLIGGSGENDSVAEEEIIGVLAARIRRIVGFRNVVGLVHSHCFVIAVSSVQDPRRGELVVHGLLRSLLQPITVTRGGQAVDFKPTIGIGVVHLQGQVEGAMYAIKQAEQLALRAWQIPKGVLHEEFVVPAFTQPGDLAFSSKK
jgi:hypothetical protein